MIVTVNFKVSTMQYGRGEVQIRYGYQTDLEPIQKYLMNTQITGGKSKLNNLLLGLPVLVSTLCALLDCPRGMSNMTILYLLKNILNLGSHINGGIVSLYLLFPKDEKEAAAKGFVFII